MLAAPLVQAPSASFDERARPRIYIAPRGSRSDEWILRASLARAGLRAPRWIASQRARVPADRLREAFLAGEPVLVPLAGPRRGGPDRLARLLHWARQGGRDVDLVPVETLWGPAGESLTLWRLPLGNPHDPPLWRRWLGLFGRQRRVILGAPGTLEALASEAPAPDDALALAGFVRNRAIKALSQTERHVLGERYKVPRLLVEQILAEPDFMDRVAAAGATAGLTRAEARSRAEVALRELYTTHNLLLMEIFSRFSSWAYRRVYDAEINVDRESLDQLRELGRSHALVFIPSHKSNFDHMIMYHLLFTAGLPPPHTAAGINMSFFPMSWILPGTGAYFIRRSFQDDPVYKEALGGFLSYLVQRRFHQEFFIEGGRTRSGKLLPPRYGMLRYIVEGCRRTGVHDVLFVPTAIAYDQLLEVETYARELGGEEKERENFGFLLRMIRSLRGRDLGRVHVRFGEAIDLADHLAQAGSDRLVVEKLAFQISNTINSVTTLTNVSVVCSGLLGAGGRALTLPELEEQVDRMLSYTRARAAFSPELEQGAKQAVASGVEALRRARVLEVYDGGLEPVYAISARQHLVASYYRNTVIHFFLTAAIADLARRAARERGEAVPWSLRIRELLKFEFFFRERAAFRADVAVELERLDREELRDETPILAAGPGILLDYLESYWVATETLRSLAPGAKLSGRAFQERCQALGRQRLLQGQVHAPQLLSNLNFENALRLASNLGAAESNELGVGRGSADSLATLAADLSLLASLARASAVRP